MYKVKICLIPHAFGKHIYSFVENKNFTSGSRILLNIAN